MKKLLLASAALAVMASAAQAKTTVNLCTGASGQPYSVAGEMIAQQLQGSADVEVRVITETGGTWGNIERTVTATPNPTQADYDSGAACHAFIGQPDGPVLLGRTKPAEAKRLRQIGKLHREYLHVLCSLASKIDDLSDLEGDKTKSVALGSQGSGAWLIWQNFIFEDEGYKDVATVPQGGIDAISATANDEIACTLVPAGLRNAVVMEADELFGEQLALVGAEDKDFNDAVDISGKPLYEFQKIPSRTYDRHLQGYFSGKKTVTWLAGVYVNTQRLTDTKALTALIKGVARARAGIQQQFGQ